MIFFMAPALVAPTTAYANSGGTGDRTASVTVTTNITWVSGISANLVDGGFGNNSTDSVDTPGTGATAIADGDYITFDFGSGTLKYIDEVKIYTSALPANGSWDIQGSDNDSSYTTYGNFTWNATTKTATASGVPPEGHRYWKLRKNGAGTWSDGWFQEVEFKIAAGAT